MKARIRKTGEIVYVTRNNCGAYVDENCVGYNLKDLVFEHEEDVHWQDVRERATIAAMQGVMGFFGSLDYNKETIAELALKQADALVEQLKKGKNETTTVYVVTRSEEHSDYVEKVFFDEDRAKAYCNMFNGNDDEYVRDITKMEVTL